MSTIATVYNSVNDSCCAKVIIAIDKMNSQTNVLQPTGLLNALKSTENTAGFKLELDPNKDRPTSGSFRKVYTKDVAPSCNETSVADDVCSVPTFTPDNVASLYKFVEHTVDIPIKREITMDLAEFQKFCISPDEYLADKLMSMRSGVWQEINKNISGRVLAYMGAYYGQVTPANSVSAPKQINLFNDPTLGYSGFGLIKDEYAKLGYIENPIIVGGSLVSNALNANANGNGFKQSGYAPTFLPNGFVDYQIDSEIADGANHLFTWAPRSLQFVSTTEITDAMIKNSVINSRERNRVTSPFGDGMVWDYFYDVDPTGCLMKIRFQTWYDVIAPVPYDNVCAKKPILHFLTGCTPNACPDSSVE